GEESAPGETGAVRRRVVLLQGPDRRPVLAGQDALARPLAEQRGGVLIGIAAGRVSREVELDDVVRRAAGEFGALLVVDHVVGRGDDVCERSDPVEVVADGLKWKYLCHGGDTLDSLATGRGAAW